MARKKYTDVSLFNDLRYQTQVTVRGTVMVIDFGYNSRNNSRWISILDDFGGVLLPRTFINFLGEYELTHLSNKHNLDYSIALSPKDMSKTFSSDYDYINWSNDFLLTFSGTLYTETEVLDKNLRTLLVGN